MSAGTIGETDVCELAAQGVPAAARLCGNDVPAVERLREAGLRPTRQRVRLAELLFDKGDRHVTAEMLHTEVLEAGVYLSLATVYNTLNQFTQAGLLRRIGPDGSRSFFDTNTSVHPHFYLVGEDILIDVPERLVLEQMPDPLPGHEIARLDIIIHICRKPRDA